MDGLELHPSANVSSKYSVKSTDDDRLTLTVRDICTSDAGELTVELSNRLGKETAYATLTVQSL